jgi:acyl-CoA thioesterase-1
MIRAPLLLWVMSVVVSVGAACGGDPSARSAPAERSTPPLIAAPPAASAPAPDTDGRPRVVTLGDSLTAGLGLAPEEAYPTLVQEKVDAAGLGFRVVNAGVSGDTSAGGLSRLDLALEGDVRVLIVALGGNDALRALPTESLKRNLSQIIERAQARGITVILAGMEAPPNFGRDYVVAFHEVYPTVAKQYGVTLLPFLLEGVAGVERLNQNDGIHPTRDGAVLVADHVWSVLEPVLRSDAKRRRGEARRG